MLTLHPVLLQAVRLLPGPDLPTAARRILSGVTDQLPQLDGAPIAFEFKPQLTAYRGTLLIGERRGFQVHAAAFIRQRRIVLETALLSKPNTLRLIVAHEIFHFVWAHFGNRSRNGYKSILYRELEARARGELGESSGVRKRLLLAGDHRYASNTRWSDYVCESFCDTAAWLYSGVSRHPDFNLASRWKARRQAWLLSQFQQRRAC